MDETFDFSDPALVDIFGAHDVGLCAGPSTVQGPTSSGRPDIDFEPDETIDNFLNSAPGIGSSGPGRLSPADADFGFNSISYHDYQNPSFLFPDQPYAPGNLPIANSINPLLVPGGLSDFDLAPPTSNPYSPPATSDAPFSSVQSLGSTNTQPTSPSLLSQAGIQHSRRLPLPPGGTSSFRCPTCASRFVLRAQLEYVP